MGLQQPELPWVAEARSWIGTKEIAGIKHNPLIVGIWPAIGITWFKDDETPWCAGAVTLWLKRARERVLKMGATSPLPMPAPAKPAAALSYLNYGTRISKPAYGCLAVKERKGGGHVTIVVGIYLDGRLACLGANQDDQVKISAYNVSDFKAFRWPTALEPAAHRYILPLVDATGSAVRSEG